MKDRIGYLTNEFPVAGQTYFWREINVLEEMGVEVDIVSTRRPAEAMSGNWTVAAKARTTYLFPPSQSLVAMTWELLRAGPGGWFRCLRSILSAEDVSLSERARLLPLVFIGAELSYLARSRGWTHLQVHSCADAAHVALFASLLSGLPYSLTLHGPLSNYGPNQKEKWRHAKFCIVITQQLYEEVHRVLGAQVPDRISIAPMGVDASLFNRGRPYDAWEGDGPFRIFSCGRINPCKNHSDLITAVGILRQRGIPAELDIAGSEDRGGAGHGEELQELSEELGLFKAVRLLGGVPEQAIRSSLERAHVFALVSEAEPLGVVTMEAMAMQMPVVVTRTGGVTELVNDKIDGLLVDAARPEQVAEAIAGLASNPELCERLGQAGRERIVQHFHPKRSAQVLLDNIHESS